MSTKFEFFLNIVKTINSGTDQKVVTNWSLLWLAIFRQRCLISSKIWFWLLEMVRHGMAMIIFKSYAKII